jgi:hypothetical protein
LSIGSGFEAKALSQRPIIIGIDIPSAVCKAATVGDGGGGS